MVSSPDDAVVSVILKFLDRHGFIAAAAELELESGVFLSCHGMSEDVIFARQLILAGRWKELETFMRPLEVLGLNFQRVRFFQLKQELIELTSRMNALEFSHHQDSQWREEQLQRGEQIQKALRKCLTAARTVAPEDGDFEALLNQLKERNKNPILEMNDYSRCSGRLHCYSMTHDLLKLVVCDEKMSSEDNEGEFEQACDIDNVQLMALLHEENENEISKLDLNQTEIHIRDSSNVGALDTSINIDKSIPCASPLSVLIPQRPGTSASRDDTSLNYKSKSTDSSEKDFRPLVMSNTEKEEMFKPTLGDSSSNTPFTSDNEVEEQAKHDNIQREDLVRDVSTALLLCHNGGTEYSAKNVEKSSDMFKNENSGYINETPPQFRASSPRKKWDRSNITSPTKLSKAETNYKTPSEDENEDAGLNDDMIYGSFDYNHETLQQNDMRQYIRAETHSGNANIVMDITNDIVTAQSETLTRSTTTFVTPSECFGLNLNNTNSCYTELEISRPNTVTLSGRVPSTKMEDEDNHENNDDAYNSTDEDIENHPPLPALPDDNINSTASSWNVTSSHGNASLVLLREAQMQLANEVEEEIQSNVIRRNDAEEREGSGSAMVNCRDEDTGEKHGVVEPINYHTVSSSQSTSSSQHLIVKSQKLSVLTDTQAVRAVAFHPSGEFYAVGSNSRCLRICATNSSEYLPLDGEINSGDTATIIVQKERHHKGSIYCAMFNPAGTILATGSNDKTVKLISLDVEKLREASTEHTSNITKCFGTESRLSSSHFGTVRDLTFIESHRSIDTPPRDFLVCAGAANGAALVFDYSCGENVRELHGHNSQVLTLSSLDNNLATGSVDHTIRLWDIRTQNSVRTIAGEHGDVLSVSFSPDGSLLTAGYGNGIIDVYSISSGNLLSSSKPHTADVRSVRFSSDSLNILSGSYDHTIVLSELNRCNEFAASVVVAWHEDRVIQARWHPHQDILLSSSADKTAILWDVQRKGNNKSILLS